SHALTSATITTLASAPRAVMRLLGRRRAAPLSLSAAPFRGPRRAPLSLSAASLIGAIFWFTFFLSSALQLQGKSIRALRQYAGEEYDDSARTPAWTHPRTVSNLSLRAAI